MKLNAEKRTIVGKKVKALRAKGIVPASIYGPKRASENIQVKTKDLLKVFRDSGFSKFVQLEIEGDKKPAQVLIKDLSVNPLKDNVIEASFYQIDEDSKISVEVPIIMEGEAPAVKQNLGFLVQQMETVSLYCFPKDLPESLTIDITSLENTGDAISLSVLKLPDDVEFDSDVDPTSAIAYIAAAQKEIVEEVPVAAVEGEEGAEGVEGAEATAEGGEAKAEEGAKEE